jgi:hypothetical protein
MKTTTTEATLSKRHAAKLLKAAHFLADCIKCGCLGEGDEIAAKVAIACLYSEHARANDLPNAHRLDEAVKHADALAAWTPDEA